MALINRFEVVNFLDLPTRRAEDWTARFRHNIFNLNGLSAAIVMTNGSGKTRLVNALMAIIARDRHLVGETRKFMAPRLPGMPPSHIRVELTVPKTPFVARQSSLLTDGYGHAGDHWVLGIYGYRNKEFPVRFYHYHGPLEMTGLVAKDDAEELAIISEDEFRARLRAAPSAKHDVRKTDWDDFVSHFIPRQHTRKMAEFQKQGGGDKAAEFFNITPRQGERFDQTFFYEHIAPELLADVMGSDADRGEYYFENTLHKSSVRLLQIQEDTARKKQQLEKTRRATEKLLKLVDLAREIQQVRTRCGEQRETLLGAARCLSFLTGPARLPGIPAPARTGEPLTDALLDHMGIIPDRGIVLRDTGLAGLLGKEVAHVNRAAAKLSIRPVESAQFIGPPAGTEKGRFYPLPLLREFIRKSGEADLTSPSGKNVGEAIEQAAEVFEARCDTNPFRQAARNADQEIGTIGEQQVALRAQTDGLRRQIGDFQAAYRAFEGDRAAYGDMAASGLFEPDALETPDTIRTELNARCLRVQADRDENSRELAELSLCQQGWERFAGKYGAETDPAEVQAALKREQVRGEEELMTLKRDQDEVREQAEEAGTDLRSLQAELERHRQDLDRLAPYYEDALAFRKRHPDEDPEVLEKGIQSQESALTARQARLMASIESLEREMAPLLAFREKFGDKMPGQFLAEAEQRREELREQGRILKREREALARRYAVLKNNTVAPGPVAQRALDAIPAPVPFELVYQVIEQQNVSRKRKEILLTLFSALLFSPVVTSLDHARQIIRSLREHRDEFPVPVFLKDEFEDFLRTSNIRLEGVKRLAYTFWVGEQTTIADCILDPQQVEAEKQAVRDRIGETEAELERTQEALSALGDSAADVALTRKADMAIQEDAEKRLKETRDELATLDRESETLRATYDGSFREILFGARKFGKGGGFAIYEELARQQAKRQAACERKQTALEEIRHQQTSLDRRVREIHARLGEIRLELGHTDFQHALRFIRNGGAEALERIRAARSDLDRQLGAINEKLRFDFEKAARYVRAKDRAEQLLRSVADLTQEVKAAEAEMDNLRSREQALKERRTAYHHYGIRYDTVLSGLMAEYAHIRESGLEFSAEELEHREGETFGAVAAEAEELRELAGQAVENGEALIPRIQSLAATIANLEVRQSLRRLSGLQREADRRSAQYEAACNAMTDAEAEEFSAVESDRIRATRANPAEIIPVYQAMRDEIARLETLYERDEKDQKALLQEMIDRMTGFIKEAEDNLILLRKVCKKNKTIVLEVDVEIIAEQEIRDAIREIISDIRQHQMHRAKGGEMLAEKEQEKHKKSLLGFIRDRIYRYVFRRPAIRLTHPNIASGKKVLLSNAVSNGEESGLGLMLQTRIAEFANQRSIRSYSGSDRIRRQLQKSNEMGFMIVDGLFSSLSNEEYINNSLESLAYVQGNFQLIGFIHAQYYINNPRIFPTLIYGNRYESAETDRPVTWVETYNLSPADQQDKNVGSMALFQSTILAKEDAGDQ